MYIFVIYMPGKPGHFSKWEVVRTLPVTFSSCNDGMTLEYNLFVVQGMYYHNVTKFVWICISIETQQILKNISKKIWNDKKLEKISWNNKTIGIGLQKVFDQMWIGTNPFHNGRNHVVYLKFRYSEKATKVWKKSPNCFNIN